MSAFLRLCAFWVSAAVTLSACAGNRPIHSASTAEKYAVELANDLCQRDSGKRPFRTGYIPASLSGDRWLWGWLDPATAQGYSVQVSFRVDRSEPTVSLSLHADAQPDMEEPNAPSLSQPADPAVVTQLPDPD